MAEEKFLSAKVMLVFAVGLALGFALGFAVTNSLNRAELDGARAQSATGPAPPASPAPVNPEDPSTFPDLSDEQLRDAVARADAAPADAELQRTAGQALYLYAMNKGKASVLPDAARILRRAHEANPKDFNTALFAGNANLVLARREQDPARLAEARRLFELALAAKPDDVIARTSLGLTYYFATPPDPRRAIREYRRALQTDPQSEAALQSLAAALIEAGELQEAERRIAELERIDASTPELANLRAQLEQKRNAGKERP
jgi:tetratricopeptide (TPR) repeat protein